MTLIHICGIRPSFRVSYSEKAATTGFCGRCVVLQVLLRWATQRGRTVMPKSVTPERIRENFHLDFVIPDHLMAVLDGLSSRVCQKYAWNPENVL